MTLLDEVIGRISALTPEQQLKLKEEALRSTENMKFIPSSGPQFQAYYSKADVMLYGGQAGGGKSGLLLGLALNEHERCLIMRRKYSDLGAIAEEAVKFNGTRQGFSSAPRPKLRHGGHKLIEFGACQHIGDEQSWQGQPHDLICFDEVVHFLEKQVRFIMGWNRTTTPGQRCRVVMASNPPVDAQGTWIISMFAPWLDPTHPNPARPGELRWFVTDENGRDKEVPSAEPVDVDGTMQTPLSRTFISASLKDNPYLANTGYDAKLDAMPEPYRSALRDGNFMAARQDDEWQAIPTAWVKEAQARWTPNPPANIPMCSIGVDIAQGGADNTVLAPRYDYWFDKLVVVEGVKTPRGSDVAGLVIKTRRNNCHVVLDMGGGYGGGTYECLADNIDKDKIIGFKGAEKSTRRTKDRHLAFTNKRTQAWWQIREALDPSQPGGSVIALPDDPELTADLTAPTFTVTPSGIKLETKLELVARIGRSPDKGDAVCMSWFEGQRGLTTYSNWHNRNASMGGAVPSVVMGHSNRRR